MTHWSLPVEQTNAQAAVKTVKKWLHYLRGQMSMSPAALGDASGYPLEHALELFAQELHRGASIVTMQLPDGASRALGPVGLVAAIRTGEDLDLSLFGGREWETIHLDFMATNPLLSWASELWSGNNGALTDAMYEAGGDGLELLERLLESAAKAGRAVTVAPLNEQLKEQYRRLGFFEDALLDPTLMFWVPPSDEVMCGFGEPRLAYGFE